MDLTIFIPTAGRTDFLGPLFASMDFRGDESVEVLVGYHGCAESMSDYLGRLPLPADRIRHYHLPAGGGIPANWNAGISQAKGRYVFIIGDDDAFAPGGLAEMLSAARDGSADVLSFNHIVIDGNGVESPTLTKAHRARLHGRRPGEQEVRVGNAFPGPPFMASLLRTEWVRGHGFRAEAAGAADIDLWLRAAVPGYRLEVRREQPVLYRVHAGSYTETGVRLVDEALAVIAWNRSQFAGWSSIKALRATELWLRRGRINRQLRAGDFAGARADLLRYGWTLGVSVYPRLWLKWRFKIRALQKKG